MAGIFSKVKLYGEKQIVSLLKRAQKGVDSIFKAPPSDPRGLTKTVLRMQQERFDKSGNVRAQKDPDRKKWKGLTKNSRRKKNKDRSQLLTDTGKLRKAIFVARDELQTALVVGTGYALVGVRHNQNRQVSAGSNTTKTGSAKKGTVYATKFTDEYGYLHQHGYPEGNLPKRAFLGIGAEDAKEIEYGMKSKFDRFLGRFG